ncbi:MAG: glutamine-hydrolyzing GMP synthase [Candidatus Bathyarchaeia archaeon]
MKNKLDVILVLDFGGQYCHLIARRIREFNVYSEIVSYDTTIEEIQELSQQVNVKGLILSGGPSSVYEKDSPKIDFKIFDLGIPMLGICYGHQLLAYLLGGRVERGTKREYGTAYVTVDKAIGVLKGLNRVEKVWMSHGDFVQSLPENFEVLAHTEICPVAAYHNEEKAIYGLQWHPEVVHTEHGKEVLKNFVFDVCKCQANWKPSNFIDDKIAEIKETVGNSRAIIALSGGIDSSAAAIIAAKALGKDLTAVFVDHGLMREGESEFVEKTFTELGINIVIVRASEQFFKKLKGVIDPEEKRRIIGKEFIRVFEKKAKEINAEYLIQGTIYPDRIESGFRKHSDKIKSHHNVAGLPTKIKFKKILEPLRDLYKDEVREIAKTVGLPDKIIHRQPFPGPGLAVRVTGEVTPEKVELVRKADKIVSEEVEKSGLTRDLWQYFAVLTDIKSTGIKGDSRAYGYVMAIRAVKSREAMTASFAELPYNVLEHISTRITNELPQVTRVVYDITHKPPATIEWE